MVQGHLDKGVRRNILMVNSVGRAYGQGHRGKDSGRKAMSMDSEVIAMLIGPWGKGSA